jgi:hypothetical protein
MHKVHRPTSSIHKEVHNIKALHVQAKQINKSAAGCVRPLLLLCPLLRHVVTTLDARMPLLASVWRWCGLSYRRSVL